MAKGDTKSNTFSSEIRKDCAQTLCEFNKKSHLMEKFSSLLWLSSASGSSWPILEAWKKSDLIFTTLMIPFP